MQKTNIIDRETSKTQNLICAPGNLCDSLFKAPRVHSQQLLVVIRAPRCNMTSSSRTETTLNESREIGLPEKTDNDHQEQMDSSILHADENQKLAPTLASSGEQRQPTLKNAQGHEHELDRLISKEAGGGLKTPDIQTRFRWQEGTVRTFKRRWLTLLVFSLFSLGSAYQWIHLNIIGNVVLRYYNDSLPQESLQKETAVDWLSMMYFLSYLLAFLPVLWILNAKVDPKN